jgi:hypothetical protein
MSKLTIAIAAAAAAVALAAAAPAAQAKSCVVKAGQGTGGTKDSAAFQAWEAVLQATDWGMWSVWMTSSQKVGTAPGYAVSALKSKCGPGGGLGMQCTYQAKLCK